jgi:glycosyltransferase involved in cell wall biosynthesis
MKIPLDAVSRIPKPLRRVLILQRYTPQYRRPFFERRRDRLTDIGVELTLAHGMPRSKAEQRKNDAVKIPWALQIHNYSLSVAGRSFFYQPAFRLARKYDLVVTAEASSMLLNYALAIGLPSSTRLALWGHGRNLQATGKARLDLITKNFLLRRADWYFAYNEFSEDIVRSRGFEAERISNVRNAVDTTGIRVLARELNPLGRGSLRKKWGLGEDATVGILVSGLYPQKRIRFLIEAADEIRRLMPSFELVIVGGGPDEGIVITASEGRDWLHHLGPRFDEEKAELLCSADVALMPGLIGLGVLDSFAAGLPVITVDAPFHSPEIAYLQPGVNSVILCLDAQPIDYAHATLTLLEDPVRFARLREHCVEASESLSIDSMAERFAAGVDRAMTLGPRRGRLG